jgi:hypothetical protein
VKCTLVEAFKKMELDINNLCNALNILVKPADKGVYREKLANVLVHIVFPIYTDLKAFPVIVIVIVIYYSHKSLYMILDKSKLSIYNTRSYNKFTSHAGKRWYAP